MSGSTAHGESQVTAQVLGIQGQEWQFNTSPPKEEKPRKQVWFKEDEELGDEPDLTSDLTHFLAEGAVPE